MLDIREQVLLKDYTTFHIGGPAWYFVEVKTNEELKEAVSFAHKKDLPMLILGGGSNMLVSDDGFHGVVICPKLFGFRIEGENVIIGASENWDECARKIVEVGLWGIENLSFVPGTSAGLAVQNVGAYGAQASDVIESVQVYDLKTNNELRMTNAECRFGYRRSIFNTTEKGRYVILGITLKLSKEGQPNTSYGLKPGTLQEMRDQVIAVRKSKGQDPSEYWSAGSFFKNPVVTEEQYAKLPEGTPRYPSQDGNVKVPAGYLLDKICNLKGLTVGGAKLSELQVINIINFNHAKAMDVLNLFKEARDVVYQKTRHMMGGQAGVLLENEPELVGFGGDALQ